MEQADIDEDEANVLELDPPDDQEVEMFVPEPQMFGRFPQLPPSPPGSPISLASTVKFEPGEPEKGAGSFMVPVTVALVFFIIASQL